jgi:ATP-dependent Clp protease ATP-binding subunit ClpC
MLVDMFERFNPQGRRVLVLAQDEARLLGHNFIGTEHILLGLLREGEGTAAKALTSLGVGLEPVRDKIEETIHPSGSSTTGSPPFTPRAKKVLELALREALQLGHNYIDTEHLLLGLVREGEGVAVQVLVSLGADLARVRRQVIYLLGHPSSEPAEDLMTGGLQPRGGPRCPACRSRLEGHVGYRVLPVLPVDADSESESLHVVFVYCLHCQVVIAHSPATSAGD